MRAIASENPAFSLWSMRILLRKERILTAQVALLSFSDTLGCIAYELAYSAQVYGDRMTAFAATDKGRSKLLL